MKTESEEMTFVLTKEDLDKINKWKEKLTPIPNDVNGPNFKYEYVFYPTGVGTMKIVRRADGEEYDLTDYSDW